MTMGEPGKNGVRNSDLNECQTILDTFFSYGHTEIDTARMYAEGTTESHLSLLNLGAATVDTKVYPTEPGWHSPEHLRAKFSESLEKLNRKKVRVFYLHAPDRSVPFEETLGEVDKMHKEGLFEIFGLSNYASWEVAEIVGICKTKGYVQPKIYQAMYNAVTRAIEPELVPCLRKFGMRLVVYNPLAGGFFAGKLSRADDVPQEGRFKTSDAMDRPQVVPHHSVLKPEDGVILVRAVQLNSSKIAPIVQRAPPDEVLKALDDAWELVGSQCPPYWR
ncbi:Aldo kereductase [Rhizoctonia solani]|uniref:Aldo kereductase n=1 Tax=Rhizoctonia solani TaxID=456999 RepID=A0A8H7M7A0_9AGAM|nr:Aldo kereductase [Rhizoctonia solani]